MADLEERILEDIQLQQRICRRYIDDIFFIWEHGEDSLKQFIETLNTCHPTIKFTAEWSKEEISFLDVNVRLRNRQLETDLHIKPTDTRQFLDSTSCHPSHCKKSISYSQALRYNRICSDNKKFDQRYNDLEKWLIERGYSERMVRTQILKARGESRDSLLERGNTRTSESKLIVNITYYPAFQSVRSILEKLQILLAPHKEHEKVFPEVPIVGFRNGKSLKDYLVRAPLPKMDNAGGSEPCVKGTCQVCDHIITTNTFTTKACGEVFKIQSVPLNCNSEKVLYILRCKICDDTPYIGKAKTKFCLRFNNYKSKHRSFRKGKRNAAQKCFHSHYIENCHRGIDDSEVPLFEKCETHKQLKETETFW